MPHGLHREGYLYILDCLTRDEFHELRRLPDLYICVIFLMLNDNFKPEHD